MPHFTVPSNSFLGMKGNSMLVNCNICTSNMFWFYPLFLEGMEVILHPLAWWLKELIAINWWLSDWVLNVPLSKHAICILECIKSIPSKYWVEDAPSELNKLWYHLKWQLGQNWCFAMKALGVLNIWGKSGTFNALLVGSWKFVCASPGATFTQILTIFLEDFAEGWVNSWWIGCLLENHISPFSPRGACLI